MTLSFGGSAPGTILGAIGENIDGFDELAIAVSYVQLSGWDLLRPLIGTKLQQVRLLCTDQLGITDPKAVRSMIAAGVSVHAYTGKAIYHPKVYVSTRGKQGRWVLGSANLSKSALQTGVEAVCAGEDDSGQALDWFNSIFEDPELSVPFDEDRLKALDAAWQARLKSRLEYQRTLAAQSVPVENQGAESAIEGAFAGMSNEVLPLNIDKAGNTVRNLERIQELLLAPVLDQEKAGRSELKQLGFTFDGELTDLGKAAQADGTLAGIAKLWVVWLRAAQDQELLAINPTGKLVAGRATFETFWTFPNAVTEYFLGHCEGAKGDVRILCQAIELLSNSGQPLPQLALRDVETLSANLGATAPLRDGATSAIASYLANKGQRGWNYPDRRLILEAWRDA